MAREKVCVVIPALDEEGTIGEVVGAAKKFADLVMVVDDGSKDSTASNAEKAGAKIVKGPHKGYEASIETGIRMALEEKFEIILTMDADAQHSPSDIPCFVNLISNEKADLAVGVRDRKQRISEKLFGAYFSRIGINDPLCGFKAYKASFLKEVGFFDSIKSVGTEILVIAHLRGKKIAQLPIKTKKRMDKSRFGSSANANIKFILAIARVILKYGFANKN